MEPARVSERGHRKLRDVVRVDQRQAGVGPQGEREDACFGGARVQAVDVGPDEVGHEVGWAEDRPGGEARGAGGLFDVAFGSACEGGEAGWVGGGEGDAGGVDHVVDLGGFGEAEDGLGLGELERNVVEGGVEVEEEHLAAGQALLEGGFVVPGWGLLLVRSLDNHKL